MDSEPPGFGRAAPTAVVVSYQLNTQTRMRHNNSVVAWYQKGEAMSTEFRYQMKTDEFFDAAKKHGFNVKCAEKGRDRYTVHMSHPKLPEAKGVMAPTAKHGSVNSNLVKYAVRVVKQLKQRERAVATAKPKPAPVVTTKAPQYAIPAPTVATAEAAMVQHAADTLVAWLDDQIRGGLRQFTAAALNNKVRTRIGLPDHEATMAAIGLLVRRNLLGEGLMHKNGKRYKAYQINPKLTNGSGVSIVEAYDSDLWKDLPQAPAYDDSKPKTVTVPKSIAPKPVKPVKAAAPRPVPKAAPAPASFETALIQEAAGDEEFVNQLIDFYITSGRYDKLAEVVVKSSDAAACERILRRVAELAPSGKK